MQSQHWQVVALCQCRLAILPFNTALCIVKCLRQAYHSPIAPADRPPQSTPAAAPGAACASAPLHRPAWHQMRSAPLPCPPRLQAQAQAQQSGVGGDAQWQAVLPTNTAQCCGPSWPLRQHSHVPWYATTVHSQVLAHAGCVALPAHARSTSMYVILLGRRPSRRISRTPSCK